MITEETLEIDNTNPYQLDKEDYSKFVEVIEGGKFNASYLTWSVCWERFKQLYPLARHEMIIYNYGDKPFGGIMQPDGSVVVHCKLHYETQDGDERVHDEYLAVRDNRLRPIQNPSSTDMENTYRRCIAKGVSTLTGFGIGLWMNEDINELRAGGSTETLSNGKRPTPGGVTVDQNVKLDALMRDKNAEQADKDKLKAMKEAGWEGVTEQMAEILIADVKAGIYNNKRITDTKRNKTIKLIESSKLEEEKKQESFKWIAIDNRTNLEVDTFVSKLKSN